MEGGPGTALGADLRTAVRRALTLRTAAAVGDALLSIDASEITALFHSTLDTDGIAPLTIGLPASPGAASGRIACSSDEAIHLGVLGEAVILVRPETTPDDVLGMQSSQGVLTARGGVSSHAAVISRGWGIPAVVGAGEVHVDGENVRIGSTALRAGDEVTIDGTTGRVYSGSLATSPGRPPAELWTLLAWADAVACGHVEVRANAETVEDAAVARRLGAAGIGLCRTEHMLLEGDRLATLRRFILSDDASMDTAALHELEVAQTADFASLLETMDGLRVTVRLLDPPLHEFLPDLLALTADEARGELSEAGRLDLAAVRRLHEANPMMGARGVRMGILRRGLYEMQVRALARAVVGLLGAGGHPLVEIMIPFVVDAGELRVTRGWISEFLAGTVGAEATSAIMTIGAMIETPRAALTAAALAEHADFFSFGTNDLTQMVFAFSRDDAEARLLPAYRELGIIAENPFAVIDRPGVGAMIQMACESARSAKPGIRFGACGEHAGDPSSIDFLVRAGIDSVSTSPFRVPTARLAVAQTLLASGRVLVGDVAFDFSPGDAVSPEDAAPIDVDEALVLHLLRIRGLVTPEGFAASLGSHPSDILGELLESGLVRHIEARDLVGLLPPGRQRHEELLQAYATEELRRALAPAYERFLPINVEFKQLCTDWQLRDGTTNDHADPAYDRACIERLDKLNAAARPILEAMASALPRLARYGPRLGDAAAAVAAGDAARFTGVMRESFHDIWMELHEDLIVLQRISRTEEGSH